MAEYVFHVLHNARPEYELDVLDLLGDGSEGSSVDLLERGAALGLNIGHQVTSQRMLRDIFQPLRDLGLMEKRRVKLTAEGQTLAKIALQNPDLVAEIVHFRYYSLWDSTRAAENCFSWSYRTVSNHLWSQGRAVIDVNALASLVPAEASSTFNLSNVSFSARSVAGILNWLEGLNPPVISPGEQERVISRRSFCPPETFLLAVDFAYRSYELDYGTNLLLDHDKRDFISQVCMLDQNAFDRVSEYAVTQFSYLDKGVGGGWGSYLSLQRQPRLEDFL